jgi:hypothetical protein
MSLEGFGGGTANAVLARAATMRATPYFILSNVEVVSGVRGGRIEGWREFETSIGSGV